MLFLSLAISIGLVAHDWRLVLTGIRHRVERLSLVMPEVVDRSRSDQAAERPGQELRALTSRALRAGRFSWLCNWRTSRSEGPVVPRFHPCGTERDCHLSAQSHYHHAATRSLSRNRPSLRSWYSLCRDTPRRSQQS